MQADIVYCPPVKIQNIYSIKWKLKQTQKLAIKHLGLDWVFLLMNREEL